VATEEEAAEMIVVVVEDVAEAAAEAEASEVTAEAVVKVAVKVVEASEVVTALPEEEMNELLLTAI
jgi:hypothetical protein